MGSVSMIDPYELLGVNIDSDLKTIKKSFYELSLVCHPDKGGHPDDFETVHSAYLYVIDQMKTRIDNPEKSYIDLEKEFKDFKEKQNEKPPTFHQIFVDHNDEIKHFNQVFNETQESVIPNEDNMDGEVKPTDPFQNGYGSMMDASVMDTKANIEYQQTINEKPSNNFSAEIIEYREPMTIMDTTYGSHHRFDKDTVSDFSHYGDNGQLAMADYFRAFSDPSDMGNQGIKTVSENNYGASVNQLIEDRNKTESNEAKKMKEARENFLRNIENRNTSK